MTDKRTMIECKKCNMRYSRDWFTADTLQRQEDICGFCMKEEMRNATK